MKKEQATEHKAIKPFTKEEFEEYMNNEAEEYAKNSIKNINDQLLMLMQEQYLDVYFFKNRF